MNFHDEIEKLQGTVKELVERIITLEKKTSLTDAPEDSAPAEITTEYLDSLSVDQVGDLYKAGKISQSTLGAAVTRKVFPQGLPEEFADRPAPTAIPAAPRAVPGEEAASQNEHDRATGGVNEAGQTESVAVEAEAAAAVVEPVADPLAKSSGDDKNAGAWTEAGNGLDYPDDKKAAS